MKLTSIALLSLCLIINTARASEADALVQGSGAKGGLCLVIGAKDTALAEGLARKGFYAQVLQADAGTAAKWGAKIAAADGRENIGVRCSAFEAEHYGTNLFNLVVVEDAGALGKAKLADLCRILVPKGVVAFRKVPGDLAGGAGKLKMAAVSVGGFARAFRKPLKRVEWKVCDSLKWRTGSGGRGEFSAIVVKDGTLAYADRFEFPGDLSVLAGRFVVRDAYNGRLLRSEALGDRKPDWYAPHVAAKLKPIKPSPLVAWAGRSTAEGWKSFKPTSGGKLDLPYYGGHCYEPVELGNYILYHHNIWVNRKTNERVFPNFLHPYCKYGQVPANGMLYNFPGAKPGKVSGVTALAPADITFDHKPGGRVLQTFGRAPQGAPTTPQDWPMFRANPTRGNSCQASPGSKPVKAWEVKLGLGNKPYGAMCGERTGLTQPVAAYGLVIVSDIDAGRIVAVDAADGKQKWVFHVGSRVDFPPTLYNGLCLFAARDGWVYCLDARKGTAIWKLLVPSRERYIGGHEKLESLWPTRSDVLIVNGIGYAAAGFGVSLQGGVRAVAFKPETGQVVWRQCYYEEVKDGEWPRNISADIFYWTTQKGKGLLGMGRCPVDAATGARLPGSRSSLVRKSSFDTYLDVGNSLSRTMEDLGGKLLSNGKVRGRTIAFSDDFSVAYTVAWGGTTWESFKGSRSKIAVRLNLMAARDTTAPLWKSPGMELVVDDIVLTPQRIYCVGHYQRVKKGSELWVVSRKDGKVVNTIPVNGFPAFMGMSAAGNKLFIATREGKLICLQAAK